MCIRDSRHVLADFIKPAQRNDSHRGLAHQVLLLLLRLLGAALLERKLLRGDRAGLLLASPGLLRLLVLLRSLLRMLSFLSLRGLLRRFLRLLLPGRGLGFIAVLLLRSAGGLSLIHI